MKFTKMHGCGNDYVYVNCFDPEVIEELSRPGFDKAEFTIRVSDRHKGIGSDGVIFINPSPKAGQSTDATQEATENSSAAEGGAANNEEGGAAYCIEAEVSDCEMEMYNADGTRSEMCGNGIRCVAKYVYDHAIVSKAEFVIESMGIPHRVLIEATPDGLKAENVRVDMGEPILKPDKIPVMISDEAECCISHDIYVMDGNYSMTCMSFGNPHAVIFMDNIDNMPIETFGPAMENHPCFPNRVNAEFVKILDRGNIRMRVWERGTGETFACGTGACAAAVASMLNGHTDYTVTVHLLGGDLEITWDRSSNHVFMTGEAVTVFDGEI